MYNLYNQEREHSDFQTLAALYTLNKLVEKEYSKRNIRDNSHATCYDLFWISDLSCDMPGFQSDLLCKVAYARYMCFFLHSTILFYQKVAGKLTKVSARPNLTFSATGVTELNE